MNKFHRKKAKGRPRTTTDSDIPEPVQDQIVKVMEDELAVGINNVEPHIAAFDEYYDMLHCVRKNKPHEWESDIYMPEFVSRVLTQIGNFVAQYFVSRDYVEPILESSDPLDVEEAKASKRLLNKLLNDKKAHYYQKVVRLLMFVFTGGYGIIKGGYVQRVKDELTGYKTRTEFVTDDNGVVLGDDGMPFSDPYVQRPQMMDFQDPVYEQRVLEDRPTFDVYPIGAVYMSPEYAYSLQDKEYVIFEAEKSLNELEGEKEAQGYFNLHLLRESGNAGDSDTDEYAAKTYNRDGDQQQNKDSLLTKFLIEERWGKFPLVVKERGEGGDITDWEVGVDKGGELKDDATFEECIITYAKQPTGASIKRLIGFKPSPHTSRPMVRFLCYVDPLKDAGFGDGEVVKELQVAVNDSYNLYNKREQLATTPAFKRRAFMNMPSVIRLDPEKPIDIDGDIDQFKEIDIRSDGLTQLNNIAQLKQAMSDVMATNANTMGQPMDNRETATVGAIMDQRASVRIGMKSSNLEFIGFTEFYDMLLTLCNDFMSPETLEHLLGDLTVAYNPQREDRFKPVSQALESEASKQHKVQMWDQVLGRIVGIPNPKTPMLVNMILGKILDQMGEEYKQVEQWMLDENPMNNLMWMMASGGGGMGHGSTPNAGGGGPQNEQGLEQSGMEQMARQMMGGM